MDQQDFTATILVKQSPATAFRAIMNFRAWWSEDIEGKADQLNEVFFYHYKDVHLCKMKLIEIEPNKKLIYQVLDNQFNFVADKNEWINTKLIFEVSEENERTKIKFTHKGLAPEDECYDICEDAWRKFINQSLYNLITTGKGQPTRKENEGYDIEMVEKWKLG